MATRKPRKTATPVEGLKNKVNLEIGRYAWLVAGLHELEPGVAHIAKRGKDFTCLPLSFANAVRNAATQMGFKATISVFANTGEVVFAYFYPDSLVRPNMEAYPVVR